MGEGHLEETAGMSVQAAPVAYEKGPQDYWLSPKFCGRYTLNAVNTIRDNPGTYTFNLQAMMALLQGIQYLSEAPTAILDVGCGPSMRSLDLKAKLGCRVVGVDYSPHMISQAQSINQMLPEDRRVELQQADAAALPYADGEFDAVTAYGLFMSIPEPLPAIRDMLRVVKHGIVCIEETQDVMTDEALTHYADVRDNKFPGRIYHHSYNRLFYLAGASNWSVTPLPVNENWDMGKPPAYARYIVCR